jgi:hypothetical protein
VQLRFRVVLFFISLAASPLPAQQFSPSAGAPSLTAEAPVTLREIPGPIVPIVLPANPRAVQRPHFHWGSALKQTSVLLGIEHTFRMTQEKTRDQLGGPFFHDWWNSIGGFSGWSDGDSFFTQYIGHPMQGAWVGYIQVQNDPSGRDLRFNDGPAYWHSRMRAMAFAAAYEVQWHLGPLSEASIGNVGEKPETLGASEFVTSPLGGFGLMIAEDALDRLVTERVEQKHHAGKVKLRLLRTLLSPNRSFANILRGKAPWFRDNRDLTGNSRPASVWNR